MNSGYNNRLQNTGNGFVNINGRKQSRPKDRRKIPWNIRGRAPTKRDTERSSQSVNLSGTASEIISFCSFIVVRIILSQEMNVFLCKEAARWRWITVFLSPSKYRILFTTNV
ncbi:hypothetical protein JTE90_021366 [Oedothorax gibbosus]|uniref:Uncharacterized protein n=1 Tax=Oedothorax gibbosus TaxID=931172 RepID=A0AAV6VFX1_9ARAC|nr:hypothetical protein JTE90_021366 [Oedothorax gibbosus]